MDEKLIIVTGYDVFSGHEKNASWEAVKLLKDFIEVQGQRYKIEKMKISVTYDEVDEKVEEIWKKNPLFVVHCGVHGTARKIKLEKCAINEFKLKDFASKALCDPIICLGNSGKCKRLETSIDVDKITKYLNENYKDMFEASCDVGKYLCGYIYLKSLDKNPSKSLFIHVPCIDQPYSSGETAMGITKIIEQCIINSSSNY